MPHLKLHLRSNGLRPWCVCRMPCWLDLDQKHWGCCVLPGQQNSAAHTNDSCLVIQVFTIFLSFSGRCGQRGMCLVQLTWNLKKNWNSSSRSWKPTCQVRFKLYSYVPPSIRASVKRLIISGTFNFRVISSWACDRGWGWWSGVRRGRVGVCPGFWKRVRLSWLYQEVMKTVHFNIQ